MLLTEGKIIFWQLSCNGWEGGTVHVLFQCVNYFPHKHDLLNQKKTLSFGECTISCLYVHIFKEMYSFLTTVSSHKHGGGTLGIFLASLNHFQSTFLTKNKYFLKTQEWTVWPYTSMFSHICFWQNSPMNGLDTGYLGSIADPTIY